MTNYLKIHYNKEKIIIFIMIIAIWIGVFNTLNSWFKFKNKELQAELAEERLLQTEELTTNANQQYFIISKVLPLLKFICETDNFDLIKLQKDYFEKYDLDLTIYVFDEKGNLKETAPNRAPNQWLMKNLFPYLCENDVAKVTEGSHLLDKKIEFTFGYGKNLISIKDNPEKIINTVSLGKECFFTWTNRENKGVLIFGNRLPDSEKIFDIAISKAYKSKNLKYAGKIIEKPKTELDYLSIEANNYFSKKSLDYGIYKNLDWYFVTNKNGEKYYTAFKINTNIYYRSILFLKLLFITIIPFTLGLINNISKNTSLSLKKIVILLFLASSIIPLAAISSVNLESLETFTEVYKKELKTAMEETINGAIQNLENYINICSNRLTYLTESDSNDYNIEEIEKNISEAFPNSKFAARNSACETIFSNFPAYSPGQDSLFKALGRQFLLKYNPIRFNEKAYNGNPFSDEIVTKDDMGINVLTNYPNKLQYFYNSAFKILLFVKILPENAGEPALLFIILNFQNIIEDYLKSIDPRTFVIDNKRVYFAAFNPSGFRWIVPPDDYNTMLFKQAKASFVTGKPTYRYIKTKNEKLYSLCVSNPESNDVCYLTFLSLEGLEKEIERRKIYIGISAFIALILSITIIICLFKQLILPLDNLEEGAKALEKQQYEVKLSVPPGNDELAQLFKEFNYMMGENYDMQMAKNIQEGLITQKFPQINNYLITGCSFPANKLCGDCLTSYELSDGRILFLIGDLTGNSIGSALMMAFVRSITFACSQISDYNPALIADAIDQMMRENQTEHMFIGLICGIFNPSTGKIRFVTRGHIYPLFIRNDDTYEWLGKPSLPLGIGRKQKTILLETELLPGESMLCFTRGLIELNCHGGLTLDYNMVEKWAIQTSHEKDQNKWLNSIKSCFDKWCNENNLYQTNDLTLFGIISQRSLENE